MAPFPTFRNFWSNKRAPNFEDFGIFGRVESAPCKFAEDEESCENQTSLVSN